MTERAFITVFRSARQADTYIFVRRGYPWDDLPEALRGIFGEPRHVMDLLLTPDRKLARTTGEKVLKAVAEKDYYLQMSEEQAQYMVEFKQRLKSRDP